MKTNNKSLIKMDLQDFTIDEIIELAKFHPLYNGALNYVKNNEKLKDMYYEDLSKYLQIPRAMAKVILLEIKSENEE